MMGLWTMGGPDKIEAPLCCLALQLQPIMAIRDAIDPLLC